MTVSDLKEGMVVEFTKVPKKERRIELGYRYTVVQTDAFAVWFRREGHIFHIGRKNGWLSRYAEFKEVK